MVLFEKFRTRNLIQIYTKNATFKKIFSGGGGACPQTPLAKRMASQHANFQISKKNSCPPS